jgi:hypothetical protein
MVRRVECEKRIGGTHRNQFDSYVTLCYEFLAILSPPLASDMHRHLTVAFDGSQTSESDPSGDRAHDVEVDRHQPRSSISAPSVLSRHLTVAFDGRVPDDVAAGESVNVADVQARDESNSMCADCSAQKYDDLGVIVP